MGGAADPDCEFAHRRRAELLFRSRMGRAGPRTLSAKAPGVAPAYAARADNRSCFDNILKAITKDTKVYQDCSRTGRQFPSCSFASLVVSGFGVLQLI